MCLWRVVDPLFVANCVQVQNSQNHRSCNVSGSLPWIFCQYSSLFLSVRLYPKRSEVDKTKKTLILRTPRIVWDREGPNQNIASFYKHLSKNKHFNYFFTDVFTLLNCMIYLLSLLFKANKNVFVFTRSMGWIRPPVCIAQQKVITIPIMPQCEYSLLLLTSQPLEQIPSLNEFTSLLDANQCNNAKFTSVVWWDAYLYYRKTSLQV